MKPKLIQDEKYPSMWHILWPDGEISDMVNKTRAKDAIRVFEEGERKIESRRLSQGPTEVTGAFK